MKITKLSLTNFRSFKEMQTIEFAPVTLLFGPNSVGKSTVLMALFYLQQILDKGQCDPLRLEALNDKYIGGFENLVHGRILERNITIKVEFDKQGRVGSSYGFLAELFEDLELGISSPSVAAETMALEFEISWSKSERTAYISRYVVSFDGEDIAEVTSDVGLKQPVLSGINYLHPLLLPEEHDDWLVTTFDDGTSIHNDLFDKVLELKGIDNPSHRDLASGADRPFENEEEPPIFADDAFVSEFHKQLNHERLSGDTGIAGVNYISFSSHELTHIPIGVDGIAGALPKPGQKLKSSLTLDDDKLNEMVIELLSDLVVSPLDNLKSILNDSLCIGPIREIPDALHQPSPYVEQKDWYSGIAAWATLGNADSSILSKVDNWIASKDKLNLGYGIAVKVDKEFTEIKRTTGPIAHRDAEIQLDRLLKEYYSSEQPHSLKSVPYFDGQHTEHGYTLWDLERQLAVTANDIGVGISQLMPLVVATLSRRQGLIACEQPELHVHPRIQIAIGDLLTQSNPTVNFLIETHSEHLILRLLKRIRETTDDELPAGFNKVTNKDISIVYIEPSESGAKTKRIEIDDEGEFSTRWPKGFFSERAKELF
jgi:hypothetical protein